MEIWVNPECSKCRAATAELDAAGIGYTVRHYLQTPPTPAELTGLLDRLGLEPWHLAREAELAAAGIDLPRQPAFRDAWISALSTHPEAIQRPIITADDGTTAIARDPETVAAMVRRGSAPAALDRNAGGRPH